MKNTIRMKKICGAFCEAGLVPSEGRDIPMMIVANYWMCSSSPKYSYSMRYNTSIGVM